MSMIIMSIILIVAIIAMGAILPGVKKVLTLVPMALLALVIGTSCIVSIPTGYTGILTTFGKVESNTLDAGLRFKAPWQNVIKMDNRLQEMNIDLACFSSDIQEVDAAMSVGYRINQQNAMLIYKEIGRNYIDVVITPQVKEVVKSVIAHYTAASLIESRDRASAEIDEKLRDALSTYNIDLNYASITNIDFSDSFEAAVEAKVKAQQDKQKAEADADRARVEAKATADAAIIAANAEAEKNKIAADAELYAAEKKAEANSKLNASLTGNLLNYYQITEVDGKWDGKLPTYVGGDTMIPVIGN